MPQKPLLIYATAGGSIEHALRCDLPWPVVQVDSRAALLEALDQMMPQAVLMLIDSSQSLALIDVCISSLPVIVVVHEEDVERRLDALSKGASDYLLMPLNIAELVVRVQTVVKRHDIEKARFLRRGCVVLDKVGGLLGDGLRWVTLTMAERQAFSLLLERQGEPVSHERLKQIGRLEGASDNALQVLIHRLRNKASACGLSIRNLRGEGYLLEYVG